MPPFPGNMETSGLSVSIEIPRFRVEAAVQEPSPEGLKEWIWKHYQGEIYKHLVVEEQNFPESPLGTAVETAEEEEEVAVSLVAEPQPCDSSQVRNLRKRLEILETVARVQRQYLQAEGPVNVYTCLMDGIIELMQCDYGFIGEVKYDENQNMYMEVNGLSFRSSSGWTQSSMQLLRAHSKIPFYHLDTLWGRVLTTNQAFFTNDVQRDQLKGIPAGHPFLNNFMGLPIETQEGQCIGMVAIANCVRDFASPDVEYLKPFLDASSNVIQAYEKHKEHEMLVNTLEQKVLERTQKLERTNRRLERANERVVQASALQLQHFACMSHEIRTPLNW